MCVYVYIYIYIYYVSTKMCNYERCPFPDVHLPTYDVWCMCINRSCY